MRVRRIAAIVTAAVMAAGGALLAAAPAAMAVSAPNDLIADAIPLTTGVPVAGSNTGTGVAEPGEVDLYGSSAVSVWYSWTAPGSGDATVDTCGSSYDTTLVVVNFDNVSGPALAQNDDACTGLSSSVTFPATGGTTYSIQVGGFFGGTGNFILVVNGSFVADETPLAPPPPDAIQQVGLPSSGSCDAIDDKDMGFGVNLTGGWTPSYAEWVNGGTGGNVCTRTLHYSLSQQAWVLA